MDGEVGEILRMLCTCDKRSREVVKATIRALIDTAPKKQRHKTALVAVLCLFYTNDSSVDTIVHEDIQEIDKRWIR